jgi:transposase
MQAITIIGLDIAKSVFQVHGVDANGQVVLRRHSLLLAICAFLAQMRAKSAKSS